MMTMVETTTGPIEGREKDGTFFSPASLTLQRQRNRGGFGERKRTSLGRKF